jgi:uncharacterized protein with von Willebrand factor type A (vWA) domain
MAFHSVGPALTRKVVDLARAMRRAGAGVTPGQTLEAIRGLGHVDVESRGQVKDLLRAGLASTPEEVRLYDALFPEFFHPGFDRTPPAVSADGPRPAARVDPSGRTEAFFGQGTHPEDGDPEFLAVRGSLVDAARNTDFARLEPDETAVILKEVRQLARNLAGGLKRRRRSQGRDRIDFRRTFRRMVRTGGEILDLVKRGHKPNPGRLILLADLSASMAPYTRFFLAFLYGLTDVFPRAEAFGFSTRLTRLTPLFQRSRPETVLDRLTKTGPPMGGGTDIGGALWAFVRSRQGSWLGPRTLVFILSDGWDRGSPDDLRSALKKIRGTGARILWLNPLAGDPGYEPLAAGIAAALPLVQAHIPFARLADVKEVGRRVGLLFFYSFF